MTSLPFLSSMRFQSWTEAQRHPDLPLLQRLLQGWNHEEPLVPFGAMLTPEGDPLILHALYSFPKEAYIALVQDLEQRQFPLHTLQDQAGTTLLEWIVRRSTGQRWGTGQFACANHDGPTWAADEISRLLHQGFPIIPHTPHPGRAGFSCADHAVAGGQLHLLTRILPYYTLDGLHAEHAHWLHLIEVNRPFWRDPAIAEPLLSFIGSTIADRESQFLHGLLPPSRELLPSRQRL